MREALADPNLFAPIIGADSFASWRTVLIAIAGEELTPAEREVYKELTGGREREPGEPVRSFFGAVGRRGGKSLSMSVLAAYWASCIDHRHVLARGERGFVLVLAGTMTQAGSVFRFIDGVFNSVPLLKHSIDTATTNTLSLRNGIDIAVRPANFREAFRASW
jgi:hypothetical protein